MSFYTKLAHLLSRKIQEFYYWENYAADFVCPDGVNFIDFAVFGLAWMSTPLDINWNPVCDISDPNDDIIDGLDLDVFSGNWLTGM